MLDSCHGDVDGRVLVRRERCRREVSYLLVEVMVVGAVVVDLDVVDVWVVWGAYGMGLQLLVGDGGGEA